jgi:hypothetical protein
LVTSRDVGSSHPGGGEAPKGRAVRPLKWYASWVQNVVRQFGLYPGLPIEICRDSSPVREDWDEETPGVPVVLTRASLGNYVSNG